MQTKRQRAGCHSLQGVCLLSAGGAWAEKAIQHGQEGRVHSSGHTRTPGRKWAEKGEEAWERPAEAPIQTPVLDD